MSFILDALKKSETERQRHHGPSMADIPYGRPRSTQPLWMVLIVGLLLINLGVLMFWLWRREPTPAAAVAPPAAAPEAAGPAPVATPAAARTETSSAPEVRSLSTEAYADATAPAELDFSNAESAAVNEPKLVRRTAAAPRSQQADASFEGVTTLDALGGSSALNLPQLHLDIHVYSAVPAERFVFINMRKYLEGQTLSEGPTVERIADDGVILSYRNQRFLMPRQ